MAATPPRSYGSSPLQRVSRRTSPQEAEASSRRQSLFSDGIPRSLRMLTGEDSVSGVPIANVENERPGPTLPAIRRTSQSMNEGSTGVTQHSYRQRLPTIEKEVDDPSATRNSQNGNSRLDTSTPTRLSRLLAGYSYNPPSESRSPSSTLPNESRPRERNTGANSLSDHLYAQGLLNGRHSDVTVKAFGVDYKLHRIMLARAPFFDTVLSGDWLESKSPEIALHPEDLDSHITQHCFELALKRIYGSYDEYEEAAEPIGLFATGCWLEMSDLIDSSIGNMLRQMTTATLTPLIKLVTANYYGRAGDKVLASAKAMLCRDGWRMPSQNWDAIPADIIREIVGGDGLFIDGEFDRWLLARRIINRRLRSIAIELGLLTSDRQRLPNVIPDAAKITGLRVNSARRRASLRNEQGLCDDMPKWGAVYSHPEIAPLLVLLDEGIHYIHLNFEQLQYIKDSQDVFGLPLLPEKVVSDALWMQLELRQRILNAPEGMMELGISQALTGDSADFKPIMDPTEQRKLRKGKQAVTTFESENTIEDTVSSSWDGKGRTRKFWIPSADCNIIMGGNAEPIVSTTQPQHVSRLSGSMQPGDGQWVSDFGSAGNDMRPTTNISSSLADDSVPSSDLRPVSYTHFPPFRFSAEFANPRLLKEKKRVYSRTIFYAGSLWNIYIQKVRSSKNPQLGVYLHRAKERESIEGVDNSGGATPDTVSNRIAVVEREMSAHQQRRIHRRRQRMVESTRDVEEEFSSGDANSLPIGSFQSLTTADTTSDLRGQAPIKHRPTSPDSPRQLHPRRSSQRQTSTFLHLNDEDDEEQAADNDDDDSSLDDMEPDYPPPPALPRTPALPAYTDARPTIKTYFKIYSPSRGGRMLSVYESAPDKFNFSQSWGWKSSTLMLDEGFMGDQYLGSIEEPPITGMEDGGLETRAAEGRLKFMVVIGNV